MYREHFHVVEFQTEDVFSAFNARFGGNGTFVVQPNGRCRPQRVVTSQGEVTGLNVIPGNPDTSKRRVATHERVLQNNVVRVLHTQFLYIDWKDFIHQITNQEEYFACGLSQNAFLILHFHVMFYLPSRKDFEAMGRSNSIIIVFGKTKNLHRIVQFKHQRQF